MKAGDTVFYKGYRAEILAFAGYSRFLGTPLWLVDPYVDYMPRQIVKETKLILEEL